jgi:hypothetical protein
VEDRERTTKMLVVADAYGNILTAMWPGVETEGAPTAVGVRLSAGQVAHEVDVPEEVYQLARPDLSSYRVEVRGGSPELIRDKPTSA